MKKVAILILSTAVGALCTTASFAGMNDERVQKRDEIWKTETLDTDHYESKAPATYSSKEILPHRQNTNRVMG
jgi:hypothetical protein